MRDDAPGEGDASGDGIAVRDGLGPGDRSAARGGGAPAGPEGRRRILAVASGGGHWQQLMLMRPAFEGHDVLYLTTLPGLPEAHGAAPARIVPDCNRDRPVQAARSAAAIGAAVLRHRPHVVISTGALPGVIALTAGKAIRARTIWVDSVANAEEMSMSGRLARRVADLWLSQWPAVAARSGAEHAGAVL